MTSKSVMVNSIDLDELDDLGEVELGGDKNSSIIFNVQTLCDSLIEKTSEKMVSLDNAGDEYFGIYYQNEAYTLIKEKFFKKESTVDALDRITNIKTFIKSRSVRLEKYLTSVNNTVVKGDLDGIEAENKISAFNKIIDAFNNIFDESDVDVNELILTNLPIKKKEDVVSETEALEEETTKVVSELGNASSIKEQASILSNILTKIDNSEDLSDSKTEEDKELSEYEQADIDGKIQILYDKCIVKAEAKDGEPDGIIVSYIEDMYNPSNTKLDKPNLLLNLLVITRMQDFEIMDWYFDADITKTDNDTVDLSGKWWNDIMNETELSIGERYVKIVNKTFGLAFYSGMFGSIAQNCDRATFSKNDYKLSIALDDNNKPIEEHFLDVLYKQMEENSLLVIPSDMEDYVNISNGKNDELGDSGQIKHIGSSNGRLVYSVNTDEIKALNGFKNGVIWINSGNQFILNPTKPIVYFNAVENPFLKRPLLYVTSMGDFKFKKNACTVMYVKDLDD